MQSNPALLLRQRKENNARLRFLSQDDYKRIHAVISDKYPEHLAAFVVSVHTGMRLGEQSLSYGVKFISTGALSN